MSGQVVDAASRLDPNAVKAGGFVGAVRYVADDFSTGPNPKCITKAEFDAFMAAGVPVAIVFEDLADQADRGATQGHHDGRTAVAKVQALGIAPHQGFRVKFAVDYDAPAADWPAIAAYLDAAEQEMVAAGYGAEGYGKSSLGRQMLLDHHGEGWWQSGAWSGTDRLDGAELFQRIQTAEVGGVECDVNDVLLDDWGQWPRPQPAPSTSPTEESLIMAVAQSDDDGRRTQIRDWCTRYWGYGAMTGDDQNILAYWGGSNPLDLVLAHIVDHPKAAAYRSAHGG